MHTTTTRRLAALAPLFLLAACATMPEPTGLAAAEARPSIAFSTPDPADATSLAELEASVAAGISRPAEPTPEYCLGPGDELAITVFGQPELSGSYVLGPDGAIGFPLADTVDLGGMTRDEASTTLEDRLEAFFASRPRVAVNVSRYENNKAYVLGRVENPGVVELTGNGTLLQAIAQAGGLPVREFRSFLARCAIIRGRDEIVWIDLIDLLQGGNIALNVPLRNGDVVFIPDSEDATVFVMGEVETPGVVPIKVRLTAVQALALAGGPTEDADLDEVWLIREDAFGESSEPIAIDFTRLLEHADFRENLELETGDVLYVPRSGIGDVDYYLRKLSPAFNTTAIAASLAAN